MTLHEIEAKRQRIINLLEENWGITLDPANVLFITPKNQFIVFRPNRKYNFNADTLNCTGIRKTLVDVTV
jgi:hypothetical protein